MPRLRIKEKFWETKDACSFYFENLDGNTLFYKPGQFLTLILSIEGKEIRRSYSLCTVPVKDKYPGITVKRVKGGIVSNYLLDHIKEGDVVECDYPAGIFFADVGQSKKVDYFLIGAGSGITPLYSILQTILHKDDHAHVVLVYANRDENSIIYKEKLEVFDFQYTDKLKVVHVLSSPTEHWQGFKQRLQPDLLQNLINELRLHQKDQSHFFICGPKDFMEMAESTLLNLGYPKENVRKEDYGSGSVSQAPMVSLSQDAGLKTAKILYRSKEYILPIPNGQTILEAALENGIRLPYSCQNGVCTACMGICVEGKVDTSEADALSDREKNNGCVLTCVGRPITDHVVIEIE